MNRWGFYRLLGGAQGRADWNDQLGRGAAVHWAGRRGLHLGQVNTLLEQSEDNAKTTVLVLHVGTNDLESLTKKNLADT